ncbi:MAG: hypothetical protein LIO62_03665 [Clostridiales bacterium]|nr:hypothetical protein [Clostridiales bacterium]
MKKKRFYNNKKRNSKWTEEQKGRKIDFADKYIEAGSGFDKFDNRKPTKKKKGITKEKLRSFLKKAITAVLCLCVVGIGYTAMDVYMERNSMPAATDEEETSAGIGDVAVQFRAMQVQSISLDNGVMLTAVVDDTEENGYDAVAFELKRSDGTVGYTSSLATVDTFGAVSSNSAQLEKSVQYLTENDIIPVGEISCYKDNIAPQSNMDLAVTDDGGLYTDSEGNTYLNPDSDAVYDYIKSIIEEVNGMGVSVFVLSDYDLPDDISKSYNDGFDTLSQKLYDDFGSDIKLLKCEQVTISDESDATVEEQIEEKITENISDDTVFLITAPDEEEVKQALDENNIVNYIIQQDSTS